MSPEADLLASDKFPSDHADDARNSVLPAAELEIAAPDFAEPEHHRGAQVRPWSRRISTWSALFIKCPASPISRTCWKVSSGHSGSPISPCGSTATKALPSHYILIHWLRAACCAFRCVMSLSRRPSTGAGHK